MYNIDIYMYSRCDRSRNCSVEIEKKVVKYTIHCYTTASIITFFYRTASFMHLYDAQH